MDDGVQTIDDDPVKRQLRKQARAVYLKSLGLAAALTLILILIP